MIFSAAFVLGVAFCTDSLAQTLITNTTGQIPANDLSYTRTVYHDNPSLDLIEIHYQDWLMPTDPLFGNAILQGMEGTWLTTSPGLQFT